MLLWWHTNTNLINFAHVPVKTSKKSVELVFELWLIGRFKIYERNFYVVMN